jgi:hypothetical protein
LVPTLKVCSGWWEPAIFGIDGTVDPKGTVSGHDWVRTSVIWVTLGKSLLPLKCKNVRDPLVNGR